MEHVSTRLSLAVPESDAGKNRVKPGATLKSASSLACAKCSVVVTAPPSAPNTGATNRSNVTMVETGFPGRPKNGISRPSLGSVPNTIGLPG